jgi:tRNA pseudouridine synthase 10
MSLLDDARALLSSGPVCDACLGRPVADRSHGLANAERGRALRTAVALADDEPFEPGATADCWVCEGYCDAHAEWADRAVDAVGDVEFETYQVGTRAPPLLEENELLFREHADLPEDAGEPFKTSFNREVGKRFGGRTGTEVDFERPHVQLLCDLEADEVTARVNSAFVYGRYRKLVRDISQTEWPCRRCDGTGAVDAEECDHCGGSGYMYEESVEGHVAPPVREAMDGTDAVFHGAGREDVDARMLGTGRPFVVEVNDPRRRDVDPGALTRAVDDRADGAVEVTGLRRATHRMVERVKELDASKTYRATVEFDADVSADGLAAALSELDGATVEQDTPQRVDHRRASMTRVREVYAAEGDRDGPRRATVEIHGEGGLYIKELVSGDGGRTRPSLAGLLGVGAAVDDLDVLAVEGEDEPFEDEDYLL